MWRDGPVADLELGRCSEKGRRSWWYQLPVLLFNSSYVYTCMAAHSACPHFHLHSSLYLVSRHLGQPWNRTAIGVPGMEFHGPLQRGACVQAMYWLCNGCCKYSSNLDKHGAHQQLAAADQLQNGSWGPEALQTFVCCLQGEYNPDMTVLQVRGARQPAHLCIR